MQKTQLATNLVSIRKLFEDNLVFIEFHSYSFFVKDKATKKVLLQGPIDKGFYRIFLGATYGDKLNLETYLVVTAIAINSIWHEKLGHVSDPIVNRVLIKCQK